MLMVASLALATGCRQKMYDTPRYDPYEPSGFYEDSLSMRPIEEGTVSRTGGWYDLDTNPYYSEDGSFLTARDAPVDYGEHLVDALPFAATEQVLRRGRQQFDIYCSPCHGRTGYGYGMIVQRGLRMPVSFHSERLREAPLGHFYNVITNGYGAMYSYKARVSPEDRWAIVAYIQALQLSQHAELSDIPADRRQEMEMLVPRIEDRE